MHIPDQQKIKTHCTAAHLLAVMLTTFTLGGCGLLQTTQIDAKDNRVFLPALRANINFDDGAQAVSEPHTGNAIEIGISKVKGSDSQSLMTGQSPIILNGTTFNPPDQLQNDFNCNFANISWRWRKFFAERSLGLEVTAGVGYSSLDLGVSSTTQRASGHFVTRGPQAGVGLIWRLNPGASIQGRVAGFITGADQGVNRMTRYELFYANALHKNLTLRAGYSVWDVNGQGQYGMSDFQLRASGPVLALDWDFNAGY